MSCAAGPDIIESGLVLCLDAVNIGVPSTAEVLVVAGGGAGAVGTNGGGGGGAGGVLYNAALSVSHGTAYSVTVGTGGTGHTGRGAGTSGNNSVFSSMTAIGGGVGSGNGSLAVTGGSGGGGDYWHAGASGTAGQGNAGGAGGYYLSLTLPADSGAGGGGAGGVGENGRGSSGVAGAGGIGILYSISGISTYYGGGGAGASNDNNTRALGGLGGGGSGGVPNSMNGADGVASTGGGGGAGTGGGGNSGSGGSGVVIIKYLGPQKATGGFISWDNGYTIHTFLTSGTFDTSGWRDVAGYRYNGTLTAGPTYSSANMGSVVFDGVDDYVTMGSGIDFAAVAFSAGFTINLWVFPTSAGMSALFSSAYGGSGTDWQTYIWSNTSTFGTAQRYGAGSQNDFSTAANYPINNWYNVVTTSNNTTSYIYVNGQQITSAATGTIVNQPASREVWLGRFKNYGIPFSGKISVAHVYNRALTAAEVAQNFNAHRGRYSI